MKTQDIFNLAIQMGIDADLRGRKTVEKMLQKKKEKFEKLSDKEKEEFLDKKL